MFYACWSAVFFACLGASFGLAISDDPIQPFYEFGSCLSNLSIISAPGGCTYSKVCLENFFDGVEDFLMPKLEEKIKMEVQHSLHNLRLDCNLLFTEVHKQLLTCQIDEISSCSLKAKSENKTSCGKLKVFRDCLRPINIDCISNIFPSIMRTVVLGVWDSLRCSYETRYTMYSLNSDDEQSNHSSASTPDDESDAVYSMKYVKGAYPVAYLKSRMTDEAIDEDIEDNITVIELNSTGRNFQGNSKVAAAPGNSKNKTAYLKPKNQTPKMNKQTTTSPNVTDTVEDTTEDDHTRPNVFMGRNFGSTDLSAERNSTAANSSNNANVISVFQLVFTLLSACVLL